MSVGKIIVLFSFQLPMNFATKHGQLRLTAANMTSANRNNTLKRYSNNFKIFREGF